ncbi:MAG: sulfurtransferase complex subunit TusD [Firmicutes bacterium]|nr:sulfurtransferase complex subunit TusD [Bacillota bacterium]
MKIGVLVLEGPYQHQASDSAYHFVKAALAKGHEICGVFFYMDGVNVANQGINPPGERSLGEMWQEIAEQGVELVVCTAGARFRGLTQNIKADWIRMMGLGRLSEFIACADRFVTFGD